MLNDVTVRLISIASRKTIRKWVVSELRYDYGNDGYCTKTLSANEYCEFGTPFDAYKHAKQLLNKYRKTYNDAIIVIKEIPIN